jgi:hypothetical protein
MPRRCRAPCPRRGPRWSGPARRAAHAGPAAESRSRPTRSPGCRVAARDARHESWSFRSLTIRPSRVHGVVTSIPDQRQCPSERKSSERNWSSVSCHRASGPRADTAWSACVAHVGRHHPTLPGNSHASPRQVSAVSRRMRGLPTHHARARASASQRAAVLDARAARRPPGARRAGSSTIVRDHRAVVAARAGGRRRGRPRGAGRSPYRAMRAATCHRGSGSRTRSGIVVAAQLLDARAVAAASIGRDHLHAGDSPRGQRAHSRAASQRTPSCAALLRMELNAESCTRRPTAAAERSRLRARRWRWYAWRARVRRRSRGRSTRWPARGRRPRPRHAVPAHVRHAARGEPPHPPGKRRPSPAPRALVARFEQQLHAEAHAEARVPVAQRVRNARARRGDARRPRGRRRPTPRQHQHGRREGAAPDRARAPTAAPADSSARRSEVEFARAL